MDGKWVDVWLAKENPAAARVGVVRTNWAEPVWAVARWGAYANSFSPFWQKMGVEMLAKCAEMLSLRKAFPAELSGLYTAEEMGQADSELPIPTQTVATKQPAKPEPILVTVVDNSTTIAPKPVQAQQDAQQDIPAHKTTKTQAKATERATAAPSAFGEVLASRPPKDCSWRGGLTIRRVGQGKPTTKGSNRYPILLDVGGTEQWASCFDDKVMQAAQDALGGQAVSGFVQEGQYGWTLYGIRTVLESIEQQSAPVAVEEDHIPF
jgi:hypothetical protein